MKKEDQNQKTNLNDITYELNTLKKHLEDIKESKDAILMSQTKDLEQKESELNLRKTQYPAAEKRLSNIKKEYNSEIVGKNKTIMKERLKYEIARKALDNKTEVNEALEQENGNLKKCKIQMMEEMDLNQKNLEKSYQEIVARDVALITYQRIVKSRNNNEK